ncbi:MAG: hypothetical protein D6681_10375 [Calditrichaeota bacterium]|nr:MAG: hypothetical protein D6681_10375 [Calditrichota bacterium]
MPGELTLPEALAQAVWERIRFLAKSLLLYDSFVHAGVGEPPPDAQVDEGVPVPGITGPEEMAREFLLLTLTQALEPANFRLIEALQGSSATTTQLAEQVHLSPLIVEERIRLLLQCGFVAAETESGAYCLTRAGRVLVEVIREAQDWLAQTLERELPQILSNSGNQT